MFKRGYVYEVCENGQKMHPIVVMEDAPSNSQLISHNSHAYSDIRVGNGSIQMATTKR